MGNATTGLLNLEMNVGQPLDGNRVRFTRKDGVRKDGGRWRGTAV